MNSSKKLIRDIIVSDISLFLLFLAFNLVFAYVFNDQVAPSLYWKGAFWFIVVTDIVLIIKHMISNKKNN